MIVNLHEYLRQLRQHPGEDITLDNLEAVLGERVRQDSKGGMMRVILPYSLRAVDVEECDKEPEWEERFINRSGDWAVPCGCCAGRGEHSYGEGPDREDYECACCSGLGGWTLKEGFKR